MPSKTVTVSEASEITGVSVATIRRWCKEGVVKGAKQFGKTWVMPLASVEAIKPQQMGKRSPKYGQGNS